MPSLLFVCTRNVCRSPFAAALFLHRLQQQFEDRTLVWRVESAGTWARKDELVPSKMQTIAREWGLDLSGHRSRCLNHELLRPFALILTMEQGHKEALRVEFPDVASRVHLLTEMSGVTLNIIDPLGGSWLDYLQMAREIDKWLTHGFEQIIRLAQTPILA